MSDTILHPTTGELVLLGEAELPKLSDLYDALAEEERRLKSLKRALSDEVAARLDHEGRRSMSFDDYKIEDTAPTQKEWDMDELRGTLAELVEEQTISMDKSLACVKYTPEPKWAEIKTLLSDPRCKARIEHCYREVPAPRYVKVHPLGKPARVVEDRCACGHPLSAHPTRTQPPPYPRMEVNDCLLCSCTNFREAHSDAA